jgi:hypothetical protein
MPKTIFRLNTYLRGMGFTNITKDYGMGKTNAKWTNYKYCLVERQLKDKQVQLKITCADRVHGPYILPNDKEKFKADLEQIITHEKKNHSAQCCQNCKMI